MDHDARERRAKLRPSARRALAALAAVALAAHVALAQKPASAPPSPGRDPRWTDAEAKARWERDAPDSIRDKLAPPIRTKHYLIFTNSSGGRSFSAKMEEFYDAIKTTYPFEERKDDRLLPVFLFRTPEEYYQFYAKATSIPLDQARKSKGHAYRDYYATWYEAPNDPVHIHEATHQLFMNRLRLAGGGSWLQEGVAEYMSTRRADRTGTCQVVKRAKHTPLEAFVQIPSLLYSAQEDPRGGDAAQNHYAQAALLIEFLREDPAQKAKFPRFLKEVGSLERGDRASIDAAVKKIYGVGLAGLDQLFVEYCKTR